MHAPCTFTSFRHSRCAAAPTQAVVTVPVRDGKCYPVRHLCVRLSHISSHYRIYTSTRCPCQVTRRSCVSFTCLPRLQKLSLNGKDMAPARGVLLNCLSSINHLVYLDLADIKLTDDMTRAVVGLLSSWPGLVFLSLAGLTVGKVLDVLSQRLLQLTSLCYMNLSRVGLKTLQVEID